MCKDTNSTVAEQQHLTIIICSRSITSSSRRQMINCTFTHTTIIKIILELMQVEFSAAHRGKQEMGIKDVIEDTVYAYTRNNNKL